MKGAQFTFDQVCPKCSARLDFGSARCPKCGEVRKEFKGREKLIVEQKGCCVLSGATTDVRLPNGDYYWPPYLIDVIEAGWLTPDFEYTEAYYETHLRKKQT